MPDTPMIGMTGRALAVSYLRVSTKEQAEKGGLEEGYSIPAQRAANHKKADEIGALIVEEFVDAGESARKADRPALQAMLDFVAHNHISYCIVHKVDRLARNRADDVTIHLALKQAGAMLVSATESIDETPSGMLLHGIMSTIAEFYSRNLATEVVKGLTQKAKTGGTPRKAPLGYINVQVRDEEGRRYRTVEVDPERGPLIAWAFQAYASGLWTGLQLREELNRRGLTTLPTPKYPSTMVAKSYLYKLLANPYYKGDVVYQGKVYKGTHTPLVTPEVFLQVQAMLETHRHADIHAQTHDHYLKGSLWCGHCRSRLILTHARSSSGNVYPYFICSGRQSKTTDCHMQSIPVPKLEELVANHYATLTIPADDRAAIRANVIDGYDKMMATSTKDLERLLASKRRLEHQQDRLLEVHLEGAISRDVMVRKQRDLEERLAIIDRDITETRQDYAPNKAALEILMMLISDPSGLYELSDASTKRLANQVFFPTGLYITEHKPISHQRTWSVQAQVDKQIADLCQQYTNPTDATPPEPSDKDLQVQRLKRTPCVPPRGLEPRTHRLKVCCSAN